MIKIHLYFTFCIPTKAKVLQGAVVINDYSPIFKWSMSVILSMNSYILHQRGNYGFQKTSSFKKMNERPQNNLVSHSFFHMSNYYYLIPVMISTQHVLNV